MTEPSAIDFVTLATLKMWIESLSSSITSDDGVLSFLITSVSQYMLTRMGRPTIYSQEYKEWYDGTGNSVLFLNQSPISSVSALQIGNFNVQASPDHVVPGYVINSNGKCLNLIGNAYSPLSRSIAMWGARLYDRTPSGFGFPYGSQNIYVDYFAGYTDFQGVPMDLQEACMTIITQNYKRRGWVDQASIAIPAGGGTSAYRSWEVPPNAERIIQMYTRTYRLS